MKNINDIKKYIALLTIAVSVNGADFVSAIGDWSDASNWSDGLAPSNGSIVTIGADKTVNWDFESGWHSPGNPSEVLLEGELTSVGAVRSWSTVWTVTSSANMDLGDGWLVLWGGGSEFSFDSGATFSTSGRIQFGGDSNATLGFNLDANGFDTIYAHSLDFGSGYNGQNIVVDMAAYTGGVGQITLLDLDSDNGVTSSLFNTLTLSVVNSGEHEGSYITYNEDNQSVDLIIPEPETYALLLGLGALTFVAIRKRKEAV